MGETSTVVYLNPFSISIPTLSHPLFVATDKSSLRA